MRYYHVWFSTKNRRWLLQGEVTERVKQFLTAVAAEKGIELMECETMIDHVHLLLRATSDHELSLSMKLLKGRSSYETFRALPDLKLDAGVSSLWQRSFNARLVPISQLSTVQRYIQTQDERLESMNARDYAILDAAGFNPRSADHTPDAAGYNPRCLQRLRLGRPSTPAGGGGPRRDDMTTTRPPAGDRDEENQSNG
jgi:REP-associated tyrosine transposase